MPRGDDHALYVLPFDHRRSVQAKLFGSESPLSDAQTAQIGNANQVIYRNCAQCSGQSRRKLDAVRCEECATGRASAMAVPGFSGFAVGPTSFGDPLVGWKNKTMTREQALAEIAEAAVAVPASVRRQHRRIPRRVTCS
jgi:myo-inositol catabolism protein IolC